MNKTSQVTVDLGYKAEDNLVKFKRVLSKIRAINKPYALPMNSSAVKEDYDYRSHLFYLVNDEDAETFAQKVRDTGLVKEVFVQEF